jgi:YVTN family beta-propeller protein
MRLWKALLAAGVLLGLAREVLADDTFILATGRRDPRMYAIDLKKALRPENNNTPNAIVSRSKTAPDRLDGRPLGDPANVVISEDGKTAYVVNHHGAIDNAEFLQHGGRGSIAVMDIRKMVSRRHDNTADALESQIDSGHFGAVGLVLLKDLFIVGNAESHLTEDGGNRVTFIDRRTGSLRGEVQLALGSGGSVPCPVFPVPFVSPSGPPAFEHPFAQPNGTFSPVPLLSPHPAWGCFPDTNGITLGRRSDGKLFLFTANGGTDDVSVIDLERALAGQRTPSPEILRIPTQIGPWGITTSPNKRWVVAANRESQRIAFEGNTISIIDVERIGSALSPEVARVRVGTSDPNGQTRPFIPSFTPNGREIVVPNFRSNNVSIVDLARAVAGDPAAEVARIPLVRPDGAAARPKGSAVTKDGRYAVISGGARTAVEPSGTVWIIDLRTRTVLATVTGVGNDPYGLALVEADD